MAKNELVGSVQSLIENENIKDLTKGSLWDFLKVLTGDYFSAIEGIGKTAALVLYARDINFWSKMQKFLSGVYKDFDDPQKFKNKFCTDNKHYNDYVQRIINMIEQLDTDNKIDYYAKITRYAISDIIDLPLYFKFSQTLKNCTPEELEYLIVQKTDIGYENSFMLDVLRLLGLVDITPNDNNQFTFTNYAKVLKKYCLDEESTLPPIKFSDVTSSGAVQFTTKGDIEEMFSDNTTEIELNN